MTLSVVYIQVLCSDESSSVSTPPDHNQARIKIVRPAGTNGGRISIHIPFICSKLLVFTALVYLTCSCYILENLRYVNL